MRNDCLSEDRPRGRISLPVRSAALWVALAAIWMLAALSVVGAFLGSARARVFFNSQPLQVYWLVLSAVFVMGLAAFPMLRRKPGLLLIHVGCVLILGGGMWGSQAGHRLAASLFGINKIPEGYVVVYEGDTEDRVVAEDFQTVLGELPFSIKLKDFRIEYYTVDTEQVGNVYVETQNGQHLRLKAEPGRTHSLGEDEEAIRVVRVFRNFKIRIEDGERIVTDDEGTTENPAVEVEIERLDANTVTRYVFERFPGFGFGEDGVQLRYISQEQPPVRDYISDVVVVSENKEAGGRLIEVNHPLHHGGYHFYQHLPTSEADYTILEVVSDSGLRAVLGGYLMLAGGVVWHFWLRHIVKRSRRRLPESA